MEEQDQSRPLHDALLAVLRQRRVIATVYTGVLMTAVAGIFLLPPQYRAAAKILLTTNQAQISTSADGATELTRTNRVAQEELNSQLQILRSRQLVEEVVEKLGVAPMTSARRPRPYPLGQPNRAGTPTIGVPPDFLPVSPHFLPGAPRPRRTWSRRALCTAR